MNPQFPQSIRIDISTELGESFALPPCGVPLDVLGGLVLPGNGARLHPRHTISRDDDALLSCVSSASLACGAHSGDAIVLNRLVPQLIERGLHIGAHPSYPDVFRFGQHRIDMSPSELEAVILSQLGWLGAILKKYDRAIEHVKFHGRLNFDVAENPEATLAACRAIKAYDPDIILVISAGAPCVELAKSQGLRVAQEAFLDRGYGPDGMIVKRDRHDALLSDPEAAAQRAVEMVLDSQGTATDGSHFPIHAETYCIHSDTPGALALMNAIRNALSERGIAVAGLASIV